MTTDAQARTRWGGVAVALAIAALAATVCGALGWWQWTRAQTTGASVLPDPPVAIAQVARPGESVGTAIGRQVTVAGTWADVDAAIVTGREVDGVPAAFLVRALTVPADQTGTGEEGTLAVVVGWRPDGDLAGVDDAAGTEASLTGYLRAPEAASASSLTTEPPEGTFLTGAAAPSALAQVWPAPLYTAVLASYEGSPSWTPLEPLEPTTELNFRSAAYAVEWWLFGAFAVFISLRWIRDNGRVPPTREEDPA